MSCGRITDEPDEPEIIEPAQKLKKTCVKCGSPDVLPRITAVHYCSSCQTSNMNIKFWRQLELLKTVLPASRTPCKALIASKGTFASVALMTLLGSALSREAPKSGKRRVAAIKSYQLSHIVEPQPSTSQTNNFITSQEEPVLQIPLEEVFNAQELSRLNLSTLHASSGSKEGLSSSDLLQTLLKPLSPSAQTSLISSLRLRLLIRTAKEQGCDALLLEDSMDDLATRTLANIALGRGASLGEEVAHCFEHQGVAVLRPLAVFQSAELRFLNQHSGSPTAQDAAYPLPSIQTLASNFVTNLQSNFPSTVSTISRTAEKLGRRSADPDAPTCSFCKLPRVDQAIDWKAANAIASFQEEAVMQPESYGKRLCYGCLVALQDSKIRGDVVVPLPL